MRMNELRHLIRARLPVDDQLGLGDEFTGTAADDVHTEDRTVLGGYEFHRAGGLQDLTLAVTAQVVDGFLDVESGCHRLRGGKSYGCDFWLTVGDSGDVGIIDGLHR